MKFFDQNTYPNLGVGVGLRPKHYQEILDTLPRNIGWFEAISENYMGLGELQGGRPIFILEKIRSHYPVVLHGVSLSIGSTDPLDRNYLSKLRDLYDRIEPSWVSDHLCWTGVGGENLHDLLPLPYTKKTLEWIVPRIHSVQDFLKRPMLFENVSSYLSFGFSEMEEWDFVEEVAKQTGCGILLDINNIYVSAINHQFDPNSYLEAIPKEIVGQFHLAGHTTYDTHLIDTHDHPVCHEVWKLFDQTIKKFGPISTLIEWDDKIPTLSELCEEAVRAKKIIEKNHGS